MLFAILAPVRFWFIGAPVHIGALMFYYLGANQAQPMPGKVTENGKLIREYCEKHPDMAHFTLARLIERDHPERWPNTHAIYQGVLYHRNRHASDGAEDPIATTASSSRVKTQFRIGDTWAKDRSPFIINGAQRIAVLNDIHFPIHSQSAVDTAINEAVNMNPTVVLLNGDIADLHDFSFHERETVESYVDREIELIVNFFDIVRDTFKDARIIYKLGNHEERLRRYLIRKTPELAHKGRFEFGEFLRFWSTMHDVDRRIEWVNDKRRIKAGKLTIMHGHEYKGGGGVNPARWLMLRTNVSSMCGHFHRASEYTERDLNGDQRIAISLPCLCDLSPDYMPYNDWNHGLGEVLVDDDGQFRARAIRIIDGKVY